jgi:hypothetical protein
MAKECAHSYFVRISIRTLMTTWFNTGLLIFASLQKNTLKIALEISCQHRQRLTLSWCSSNRVRNNGLQIEIKSTLIQCRASSTFCLMLHCSTHSTQSTVGLRQDQTSICIIPSLAIQALDGGISSTDTVTRSLYISNIPHTLTPIPRIWPSSPMIPVCGHLSRRILFTAIGQVRRQSGDISI